MGWGDELMVTGEARVMQERDPRKVRVCYNRPYWHEAYANNPRIAGLNEKGNFQKIWPRQNNFRPYATGKTPTNWTWREYRPPRGELYFSDEERDFGLRHAGRIILEPHIKQGASPNKQWGWVSWNKLGWLLMQRGLRVTQLGLAGTALLDGADFILTPSMRHAAAVMANARAAVLPEGGLHHVAAAVGTPAVVIFGGFISPASTGYTDQANIYRPSAEHPLGCGMRVACEHCAQAMKSITPAEVFDALGRILQPTHRHAELT
jgi:ADP-heptose:LPS heptosyltransferase